MSKRYTEKEDSIIREMFADFTFNQIGEKLNRSFGSVASRARKLGLEHSPEKKRERMMKGIRKGWENSKKTRFRKGQISHNKGMKMTPEQRKKFEHTFFKKGQIPHNHVPVGSTITTNDGYLKIKTAEPNKWQFLHRYNWEKENSHVPTGMIVVFKDNNKLNCDPPNLELITRSENMSRNTIHNYPEEIVAATMAMGRLTREINKQTKD